nr:MAG TPA: hypothetical protein [Caudoviricetes sp.]
MRPLRLKTAAIRQLCRLPRPSVSIVFETNQKRLNGGT